MPTEQSPEDRWIQLLNEMATFWLYSKVLLGNSSLRSVPQQTAPDGEIAISASKQPPLTAEELDIVWEIIKSMFNTIKDQIGAFTDSSQAGVVYPCLGLGSLNRLATEHLTGRGLTGQKLHNCSVGLIQLAKDVLGLAGGSPRTLDPKTIFAFAMEAIEIAAECEETSPLSESEVAEQLIASFLPLIQKVKEADDRTVALKSILSLEDDSMYGSPKLELVFLVLTGLAFSCTQYFTLKTNKARILEYFSELTNLPTSQASSDLRVLHRWAQVGRMRVILNEKTKEAENNDANAKDGCDHEK